MTYRAPRPGRPIGRAPLQRKSAVEPPKMVRAESRVGATPLYEAATLRSTIVPGGRR